MSRRPARFTEADLFRAAKAAKRAGMTVEALADGTIRIVPNQKRDHEPPALVEPPPQPLV